MPDGFVDFTYTPDVRKRFAIKKYVEKIITK